MVKSTSQTSTLPPHDRQLPDLIIMPHAAAAPNFRRSSSRLRREEPLQDVKEELVKAARNAVKDHLENIGWLDSAGKELGAGSTTIDDDDIEVVEEKIVKKYIPKNGNRSTKTCVPIRIPKSLHAKILENSTSNGDVIDLYSKELGFGDLDLVRALTGFADGRRITNCSLRILDADRPNGQKPVLSNSEINGSVRRSPRKSFNQIPVPVSEKKPDPVPQRISPRQTRRRSARMSFGSDCDTQHIQAKNLKRKRLLSSCELNGQPAPKVLIVSGEEKAPKLKDSVLIDVEEPVKRKRGRPPKNKRKYVPKPLCKMLPPLLLSKTKFLQRKFDLKDGYLSLDLFKTLFSDMKMNLSKLMTHMLYYDEKNHVTKSVHHNLHSHFIYHNCQVSHLSLAAARELCALFGNNLVPKFIRKTLKNLIQSDVQVQLERVNLKSKKSAKSPSKVKKVINATACKRSTRIKHPTAKLMDCADPSLAGSKSCLMASFSSDDDCSFTHDKSVTELVSYNDNGHFFTGKLRPKYRHLRSEDQLLHFRPPSSPSQPMEVAKQRLIEPEVVDCFKKPQSPPKTLRRLNRSCRKFASNDVLQKYTKQYKKPPPPPPPTKKVKVANVDLPMFTLSGLIETKPVESEGWFVNKISQLRKISTEASISKSNPQTSSSNSSVMDDDTQDRLKRRANKTKHVVKVHYSNGLEPIVDLNEFSRALQLQIATLESFSKPAADATSAMEVETASATNDTLPTSDIIEAQRVKELLIVAKKVEKISCQGINRPKVPFKELLHLPPGWIKVNSAQGTEFVSPDGLRFATLNLAIKHVVNQQFNQNQ